ncbi:hypothetical protein [Corallococcus exercitus]|uniref:Uncharacterized protein n=1 Tax=Corallococcus exercitus TaxID=2316736 RepID=A0A7Y4NED6_9BACT|nr:hypothetical protein [Corallococcus exercitus]NOK11202.1 hypothetical protein [Corallococcus exercitus]
MSVLEVVTWQRVVGLALWLALGGSAWAAGPWRAVARVASSEDRALLERVRGQSSDLPVVLEAEAGAAMEASPGGAWREAERMAMRQDARAVLWFTRAGAELRVSVAAPRTGHLFLRSARVEGTPETLTWSVGAEALALAVRSALRAVEAGEPLGEVVASPPPPPVVTDPPAPPAPALVAKASPVVPAAPVAKAPSGVPTAPVAKAPPGVTTALVAKAPPGVTTAPVAKAPPGVTTAPVAKAPSGVPTAPVAKAPPGVTTDPGAKAPSGVPTAPVAKAPSGVTTDPGAKTPSGVPTAPVAKAPPGVTTDPGAKAPSGVTTAPVAEAPPGLPTDPVAEAPPGLPTDPVAEAPPGLPANLMDGAFVQVGLHAALDGYHPAGQQGLSVGAGRAGPVLRLRAQVLAALPVHLRDAYTDLRLAQGSALAWVDVPVVKAGAWEGTVGLGAGVAGFWRRTEARAAEVEPAPSRLLAAFVMGPAVRVAWRVGPTLALEAALSGEVLLGRPRLGYAVDGGFVLREDGASVRPRLGVGMVIFP